MRLSSVRSADGGLLGALLIIRWFNTFPRQEEEYVEAEKRNGWTERQTKRKRKWRLGGREKDL